jgi:7-cyano-7-deazaguanine reductase
MIQDSELGKKSHYSFDYDPSKLFPVPRGKKRLDIAITDNHLPFYGFDIWNHYEVSWLNAKGKPIVALAEIIYACDTPNII